MIRANKFDSVSMMTTSGSATTRFDSREKTGFESRVGCSEKRCGEVRA